MAAHTRQTLAWSQPCLALLSGCLLSFDADLLDAGAATDAGVDRDPIDSGSDAGCSSEPVDCSNDVPCSCEPGCRCSLRCPTGANCSEVQCPTGATCSVEARGASNVVIRCIGGASCEVDCTSASNCSLECLGSAECVLECEGASNCESQSACGGGDLEGCPGDVWVCRRACP